MSPHLPLTALLFVVGAALGAVDPETSAPEPVSQETGEEAPAPLELLQGIDARVESLPSIRYGVVRTTHRLGTTVEERWRFAARGGGPFRVDYAGDTTRQVAYDGQILWDYIPAAGKARKLDTHRMAGGDRLNVLQGVMEKVAIPGLRTGADASGMVWEYAEPPEGAPEGAIFIAGRDSSSGEITFLLDPAGQYILESEVRRAGAFVLAISASRHREVAPGSWVPTEVTLVAPEAGGEVRVVLKVTNPVAGESLPDNLFTLNPDPSIKIETAP